eukprot:3706798-Pleurochrysis_carterae.AAC.1
MRTWGRERAGLGLPAHLRPVRLTAQFRTCGTSAQTIVAPAVRTRQPPLPSPPTKVQSRHTPVPPVSRPAQDGRPAPCAVG